uniref:Uncharacterized protein n=1 Tax=Oryza nivara TaxID=4536 RepID=A0A0E0IMW5_ORYNI
MAPAAVGGRGRGGRASFLPLGLSSLHAIDPSLSHLPAAMAEDAPRAAAAAEGSQHASAAERGSAAAPAAPVAKAAEQGSRPPYQYRFSQSGKRFDYKIVSA